MTLLKINDTATTNKLLLVIVLPLIFYILRLLSFIFAPLMVAFFITLLFMPFMRWMLKRHVPRFLAIGLMILIVSSAIFLGIFLIKQSGKEFIENKEELYQKLDIKVGTTIAPYAEILGIDTSTHSSAIKSILLSKQISETIYASFGETIGVIRTTASFILLTLFFLILLLAGSLNLETMMGQTLFNTKMRSVRTYMVIEKSIVKFLKVKFIVSFFTGIGFGLICWFFEISFPLFWGLLAFALNFIQLLGSVISTAITILFVFIEIDQPGTVLVIGLLLTSIQLIFGSVFEPIMMGKSFRINTISILVMLMFWGFMWGMPGLILSIPITVLIKTISEQFEGTKVFSKLMS